MRILVVSNCKTHPTGAGNSAFILNNVKLLMRAGHEVDFLFFSQISYRNDKNGCQNKEMLKFWGQHFYCIKENLFDKVFRTFISRYRRVFCRGINKCDDYYPHNLHRIVNKLNADKKYDVCIVNYYFLSKLLEKINIPLKGLWTHDYYAYKSILVGNRNVGYNTDANEEAKALQRSPHIFALNSGEAEYFRRLSPHSRVYTVYNYYNYYPQPIVGNHNLLFLSGNNEYNVNGLVWFLEKIYPEIKESIPDAKLIIGGSVCSKIKDFANRYDIELMGYVNQLSSFYCLGDVAINPTYQGTGLKIKTFEAISYDKVVLAHPHSADGIFKNDANPIFFSEKPKEWVDFLSRIWKDEDLLLMNKKKNKKYIEELQCHIKNEYKKFLGTVK